MLVLNASVLHIEHLLFLLKFLSEENATLCPEENGRHPGKEGANNGKTERPREKVVLMTGHPVTVVAANAKDDHCNGAEEGCKELKQLDRAHRTRTIRGERGACTRTRGKHEHREDSHCENLSVDDET